MNGDEMKKDACSVAESVLRRFEEVLGKARAVRTEMKVVVRLVTGGDGERGKKESGEKIEAPDSILAFLGEKAEEIWSELVGLDLNIDHLKEQIGMDRFEKPGALPGRER